MKRRTFDVLMSVGGLVIVVGALVLAAVFHANADFAKGNVRDQLTAQNISFPPAEALSAEEKEQEGVVKYAGQQVTTGDQARVYANEFIGLHLKGINGGKTYSQTSTESRANPDDQELAGKVQTLFRGETLRGLLLTSYAFWTLGEKADQTALILVIGAGVMLALSVLGFWHAGRTPKRQELRVGFHSDVNGSEKASSSRRAPARAKR